MGLLDEIKAADQRPPSHCIFAEYIASLDPDDQKDVRAALDDLTITSKAIYIACKNRGYLGGDSVLRRHRRKECLCH